MDTTFYSQYIPRRMQELGHGDRYFLKLRHFVLAPAEVRNISAYNEYYFLLEPDKGVSIASSFGLFDLSAKTNELQYEHQGKIRLTNLSLSNFTHIQFIQVIPKR